MCSLPGANLMTGGWGIERNSYNPVRDGWSDRLRWGNFRCGHLPRQPFWGDLKREGFDEAWWLVLPMWPLILLLMLLPVRRLARTVHAWRTSVFPGTCPHCAYDLRATPDRCPECGKAIRNNANLVA